MPLATRPWSSIQRTSVAGDGERSLDSAWKVFGSSSMPWYFAAAIAARNRMVIGSGAFAGPAAWLSGELP